MVTVTELKELPGGGDPEVPHETPRPTPAALPRRLPATTDSSREAMLTRQQRLRDDGYVIEQIAGRGPEIEPERLERSTSAVLLPVPGAPRIAKHPSNGASTINFRNARLLRAVYARRPLRKHNRCRRRGRA